MRYISVVMVVCIAVHLIWIISALLHTSCIVISGASGLSVGFTVATRKGPVLHGAGAGAGGQGQGTYMRRGAGHGAWAWAWVASTCPSNSLKEASQARRTSSLAPRPGGWGAGGREGMAVGSDSGGWGAGGRAGTAVGSNGGEWGAGGRAETAVGNDMDPVGAEAATL